MTAVVEGERVFVKYPYGVNGDDEEVSTVIEYFETQTLPLSFDFTKDNFGRIFTGSLNVGNYYFLQISINFSTFLAPQKISNQLFRLILSTLQTAINQNQQIKSEANSEKLLNTTEEKISTPRGLFIC